MAPKLIALSGPLRATTFSLADGELSVGRALSNGIVLDDISVSRRHSLITCEGGRPKVFDLDSHNGTFVNELPVKERELEHGDRIKIGGSLFLFLQRDDDVSSASNNVRLEDGTLLTKSAVRFRLEDALYPMARDLSALMRVATTVNSIRGLAALERALLEQIFSVVPAQRAALLFADADSGEFTHAFGLERDAEPGAPVRVSRTVARQVLGEGVSLLSNEVFADGALGTSESLLDFGVRALVCVPLVLSGRALGVLYLDTSDPSVSFTREQLRLLTAIANCAVGALENARHVEWLEGENRRLRSDTGLRHSLVGESEPMRRVLHLISKVAPAKSNVLITGESGTGKELAARAIHQNGPRADKTFLAVNCAALSESLLESELFGHEKGAFTGAHALKRGRLEVAEGGTLFLDEIGEMSHALQAKLLRVTQEREFTRVGGTRAIKADIRLIAATNRDLKEAIRRGSFREDLYFRLNVVSVAMPPLRERREDIPLLVSYFVAKYAESCNRHIKGVSPRARATLASYDWPGNVRELENAVERAVVLGSTDTILPEDLPEALLEHETAGGVAATKYHEAVNEAKRQIVRRAVTEAGGSYTEAARLLGINANNLHRLVRNLNMKSELQNLTGDAPRRDARGDEHGAADEAAD
ncbi:MAG: sigma 54-interacting transcriptional regulator [Pyrinomonadaceae bacterium]